MIALQDASLDIWASKYQLKNKQGVAVEASPADTFKRVAKALASVEKPDLQEYWKNKFLWALEKGAVPAGRILSNAGAEQYKPATSLINCTVSNVVPDSMTGILGAVHEAGLTLKAGCGIGYEFSTLRPKGAFVAGAGANTSGPLSFMDIFDKMCFTVSSAGGRRGAQMGTFDISHPDILDFIKAKRENGRLRQFNLSCLITDEFMNAVKADGDWQLVFPISKKELNDIEVDFFTTSIVGVVWKKIGYATGDNLVVRDNGEVLCRVYKTVKASRLWDLIMSSTYDFAEPGFILIDQVNEMNNNWFCENIRSTNPCAEQPLPPNGACLLGSINLTSFVTDPFTVKAQFDFDAYNSVIAIFTRMLDNVVEISGLPLESQREELARKRRHGMGFFGLGSALAMMQIRYGSNKAVIFTKNVTQQIAIKGLEVGLELAKEKGAAPIMDEDFVVTSEMLVKRPEMVEDGLKVGDIVKGKVLWAKYSRYLQKFSGHNKLLEKLVKHGCRFTHHSSIAPTGTMALSVGNNASNGIEPSFSHSYFRNVIREGKKSKEKIEVTSYEMLLYRQLIDGQATPETLPEYFTDSNRVTPKEHVDMQAAAQYWVDSAISKTINVQTDIAFDDFKGIYQYAYEQGLKGCTTFRFNPEAFQGVLVTEKDLAATTYKFTLEDGSVVELKGNEEIEYDGEIHSAANLYDALKEGYYGKF